MENNLINSLTFLYSLGGVVSFLGFIPTMKDLWQKKPSANTSTYLIWTITSLIALLYGAFILKDPVFITVVSLQLSACFIVLFLKIRLSLVSRN